MNTLVNNPYYKTMLHKNRLMPFFIRKLINGEDVDELICFITFYVGNSNEENKYVRENMWDVLEDNPEGNVCFIDQLWTSKKPENAKFSYEIWHRFKSYIKSNFSNVQYISFRRWKNGQVYVYKKKL